MRPGQCLTLLLCFWHSRAAKSKYELVALIEGATGSSDFPSRLGTTASTLAATANQRFSADNNLLAICQSLEENTETGTLTGFYNGFNNDDARVLAFFLASNTKLSQLLLHFSSISDSGVGATGAAALAEALKVNRRLSMLSLEDNSVGAHGAAALAEALKVNTRLSTLNLSYNHIRDDGAAALAEALKVNTGLSELDLYFNHISADGRAALTEAAAVRVVGLVTHIPEFSVPSPQAIDFNRRGIQSTDSLEIGDTVVAWPHSATHKWRVQSVADTQGLGSYSLISDDGSATLTMERWQLFRVCPPGSWLANLTSGCIDPPQDCAILEAGVRFVPNCSPGCNAGLFLHDFNCTACPTGTYGPGGLNTNEAESCIPCSPGSFAPTSATATCTPCPTGRYGNATGGTSLSDACPMFCPAGTQSNGPGQSTLDTACSPCTLGTYSTEPSATLCSACPAGTQGITDGAASLAEGCSECPAGSFTLLQASTVCQPCAIGKFGQLDRVGADDAYWACPHLCPTGTVGVSAGETSQDAACEQCPQGTANPSPGESGLAACQPCNATHGTVSTGMAHCVACPAGSFRNSSAMCEVCPRAHIHPYSGGVGQAACQPCPAGSYKQDQECLPCSMGTFNPAFGSASGVDECTRCDPGHVSRVEGASSKNVCVACPEGTYANASTQKCDFCPAGTFSASATADIAGCVSCEVGSIAPFEGLRKCTACPLGTVADESRTECVPCRPCTGALSNDCLQCSVGTQPNCTSGACDPCPVGTTGHLTPNGPVCGPCLPGTYGTQNGCIECPAGTYRPSEGGVGSSACVACPVGTYSDFPGANSLGVCKQCPAGTYNDKAGAPSSSNCTLCPEGTYSDKLGATSVAQCDNCPEGTSSDVLGATSEAVCQDCPLGRVSEIDDNGAQVCVECSRGTWHQPASDGVNATCVPCQPGKYGTRWGATAEDVGCALCPGGTFSALAGTPDESACKPCPAGTFSDRAGSSTNATCKLCQPGTFSLGAADSCQNCPLGKYSAFEGATSSGACLNCPQGTFGKQPALPSLFNCSQCPVGKYGMREGVSSEDIACGACQAGTFSALTGAPDEFSCEPCPAGTFSEQDGASSNATCKLCPAGTFAVAGSLECSSCPLGKFSAIEGAALSFSCSSCPQGTFGSQEGAASVDDGCTPCPTGTSSAATGATTEDTCAPCAPGAYADAPGTATCAACPPRRTTAEQGTASHLACRCEEGAYATQAVFAPTVQACADCPKRGAMCEPGRLPAAAPGYWHDPQSAPALFFACSPAEACVGGDLYAGNMTARCALAALQLLGEDEVIAACSDVAVEGGGPPQSKVQAAALIRDPNALCAPAYTGQRCSQCAPNHYRLSSLCQPCPDTQWLMLAAVIMGMCVMSAAAAIIVKCGVSLAPLTIGVDFFQTLARVSSVRAGWSATATAVLGLTRVFEVDMELTAPECMVDASFAEMWSAVMVLPVVCFGLLLVGHVALVAVTLVKQQQRPQLNNPGYARALASIHLQRFASEALLLLQVAYVQLSVKSLSAIDCTSLPNGKQALDASPDIICWEGEHWALVGRAVVALMFYLVGIPLLFAGVLRYVARVLRSVERRDKAPTRRLRDMVPQHVRKASLQRQVAWAATADRNERKLFAVHQTASSLFERFRPEHLRWLLVIMARKVVLSAVTVLQSSRPGVQLAGFAGTLFVALVAQIKAQPYERVDDSAVEQWLESRTASRMRRQKGGSGENGRSSRWHWLHVSAYRTFLDSNAMEEASLMSSMAIVQCALVYYSSRVSEQAGYPMDAVALQLLDAFLVGVVACVSLYMVALVVIPLVASGARGRDKKARVAGRAGRAVSRGGASQASRELNPMVATTRQSIARVPAADRRPRVPGVSGTSKHALP